IGIERNHIDAGVHQFAIEQERIAEILENIVRMAAKPHHSKNSGNFRTRSSHVGVPFVSCQLSVCGWPGLRLCVPRASKGLTILRQGQRFSLLRNSDSASDRSYPVLSRSSRSSIPSCSIRRYSLGRVIPSNSAALLLL